jgi:branched-chain amino acid transport system permease protein
VTPRGGAAVRWAAAAAAVAIAAAVGFVLPSYPLVVLTEILILAIFALGFNLLFGSAGLLSFGQGAYFGVGGYAAALALVHGPPSIALALGAGVLSAALAALALGALAVRRDEIYFSILTLGLGMMVYTLAFSWRDVTGGSDGLTGFPVPRLDLGFAEVPLARPRNMYLLCLAALAVVAAVLRRLVASPFGLLLRATRENRGRVPFAGGSVPAIRLGAFVLSGAISGLAGVLFTLFNRIAAPDMAHWSFSARPVLMSILGGSGTFLGPVVGAAAFLGLEQLVTRWTQDWLLFLGLVLVPLVLFFPRGLVGTAEALLARRRAARPGAPGAPGTAGEGAE